MTMTVAAAKTRPAAQDPPNYTLYQLSVEQYDRMVETGILGPDDRVELREGWIVEKVSHKPPRARCIGRLTKRLLPVLPEAWELRCQTPIALARSEPEPDFAIIRGPDERYASRHPRPDDIGLLIEVADSSRLGDRRYKGELYAKAKIGDYWIVNLVERIVEVYSQPKGGKTPAYRKRVDYRPGEQVPPRLDGAEIALLDVAALCLVKC